MPPSMELSTMCARCTPPLHTATAVQSSTGHPSMYQEDCQFGIIRAESDPALARCSRTVWVMRLSARAKESAF
eukprot:CAMPEP_0196601572 /NCGR_PEP_ID=MMETSP1081-20130531/95974_1 /TAXON_ID=36882 /ORGANISM="Pyramimonas amylifera, Strain CCMP720" /LENGTH=72 /DNA_ID=CAMNT_0041927449 /DNA_START=670 /DNA_END=888 /DNA_ORIENTATION=+